MADRYAAGTAVAVNKTIGELDRLVSKHGASGFVYGRDDVKRVSRVMFRIADRSVRFEIRQPDLAEFRQTPTGRTRVEASAREFAAEDEKRRWRALFLIVKALLVAVQEGVISLSDAFLPYTMLPSGDTVGQWASPQLDVIAATAQMPAILPGAGPSRIALPGRVGDDGMA